MAAEIGKKRTIRDFLQNKYSKFIFWTVVFILFVIWIGNWWLLFFIPIIFDFYISRKVNWTFWKKRDAEKKSKLVEWIDAIVFAVIAATIIRMFFIEAYMIPTSSMEGNLLVGDYLFVSKYSYGPRMPNTPLAVPFTHHTMPGTRDGKPYSTLIQLPYKRLSGLTDVKRNDIVVFNFPTGDTVCVEQQNPDYYQIVRRQAYNLKAADKAAGRKLQSPEQYYAKARQLVHANFTIDVRPVDKRENYVKRCIAMPGDSLEIKHRNVYINGKPEKMADKMQFRYYVHTNKLLNTNRLKDLGLSDEDMTHHAPEMMYSIVMNKSEYEMVKNFRSVTSVENYESVTDKQYTVSIFPHSKHYKWNIDNYGPLWIPEKGATVKLDTVNIAIYERVIDAYEDNDLEVKDGKIFINGKETDSYTFKMNYYFMMGDNRHGSADSRYWGFVPEDHIVGTPLIIWMSIDQDPDKSLFESLRTDRLFKILR